MRNFKELLFISLNLVFIFSSCSIDKKVYTSGYHISWNNVARNSEKQITLPIKDIKQNNGVKAGQIRIEKKTEEFIQIQPNENISASIDKEQIKLLEIKKNNFTSKPFVHSQKDDSAINKIFKQKVITYIISNNHPEINHNKFLFFLFLVLAILTIATIIGAIVFGLLSYYFYKKWKDVSTLEAPSQNADVPQNLTGQKFHWAAIVGLITGILLLFPLAILFSLIALRQIKKYPDKYKGQKMAKLGLILGLSIVAFLIYIYLLGGGISVSQ